MSPSGSGAFVEQSERSTAMLAERRLTDEQRDRAARHVASNAHNADDCRALLEALGLLDVPQRWRSTIGGRRVRIGEAT